MQYVATDLTHHILFIYLKSWLRPNTDVRLNTHIQLQTVQAGLETFLKWNWFLTVQNLTGDVYSCCVQEVVEVKTSQVQNRLEQLVTLVLVGTLEQLADLYHFLQYIRESLVLIQDLNQLLVLENAFEHYNHILIKLHVLQSLQLNCSLHNVQYNRDLIQWV